MTSVRPIDRPFIVMSGVAGSGKSTIANAIGISLHIPVLSVDPIESAIVVAGIPRSFETGLAAYLVAQAVAQSTLAGGLGVVIDAANYVEHGRNMWRNVAHRNDVQMRVIECVVSDREVHATRLSRRRRGLAIPEPTAAAVESQRREWVPWPEPHLVLDAGDPSEDNIRRALAYVTSRDP